MILRQKPAPRVWALSIPTRGIHSTRRWTTAQPSTNRSSAHNPRTGLAEEHVYVLTLATTPDLHDSINDLRRKYFPAHRNRVPAHLTLFHALPHSKLSIISSVLEETCRNTEVFSVSTGKLFRLRRGIGIAVSNGRQEAKTVQSALRDKWKNFLSQQDNAGWNPHWTIMNKVDEESIVAEAFEELRGSGASRGAEGGFKGASGEAVDLTLWRYDNAFWMLEKRFSFQK